MKKYGWRSSGYVAAALLGFLIGFPIDGPYWLNRLFLHTSIPTEERLGQYRFINPLLDCDLTSQEQVPEFRPLEKAIQDIVDQEMAGKHVDHLSVYFRSLNSGRWVGINETDHYIGASLMKLPFLIAYQKQSLKQPGLLDQELTYQNEDPVPEQNIPPSHRIELGKNYPIKDLLYRMIVYSGNHATALLIKSIDPKLIDQIFTDLGITVQRNDSHEMMLSPKDYSILFRVLYNASYLGNELSDQALTLLSQAEFKDGLVAGVPEGTTVAHKFGERTVTDGNGNVGLAELHDCGIVYYDKHPYFLCVMTQGKDLKTLEGVIQRISKTAYDNVVRYWNSSKK